ncbi:MAG: putative metal-binding motif-containing protein [Myxococcota bacterium]|nr:putative metal-binding motif-containing protein [Myxococcota bacterium]
MLTLLSIAAAGCASGGLEPDAGGGGTIDARVREGGLPPTDARVDGTVDGGRDLCGTVTCELFHRCVDGECAAYPPCAGDGSCPTPGDVCTARYCVPGDVDVDGDGSPASEDCDETDPTRSPLATETCNAVDDDCDESVDEGDPTALCASNPGGGICAEGSCGCPAGTFDLDRDVPGCECVAMPPQSDGQSCETAIDLGTLDDSGQRLTVTGNVMPDDRTVWYRFLARDTPDTACDNFHVRAQITDNPGDTFELTVFQGACNGESCADTGFTDYRWATDFRGTVDTRLTGECPCWGAPAAPVADVSACSDNSQSFYVRMRRRAGSALSCLSYTLELSNGLYDS